MSYPRHKTIDHYLDKVRLHTEPYSATILGKEVRIHPGVMSPKYDRSSRIFLSLMNFPLKGKFLDMGCGTGIISLFAADHGAEELLAVDINEAAVKNTKENFDLHALANAQVQYSDLFSGIKGSFDTIFFNAPFHGNEAMDDLELGTSDLDYETLKRFFLEARNYLAPDGQLILGFSDMGNNELVREFAKRGGFSEVSLDTQNNGDWTAYLYTFERTLPH